MQKESEQRRQEASELHNLSRRLEGEAQTIELDPKLKGTEAQEALTSAKFERLQEVNDLCLCQ